ncbi:Hypothetical protein A7982_11622 [Minicystis rosea]|nr:Hypothetical protein A7982_11622 [Minicystis rosea]
MTPQQELVEFLVEIPLTGTFDGRSQLLEGVLGRARFDRSEENRQRDLELIIRQVRRDRHALRCLVDNLQPPHLQAHEVEELKRLTGAIRERPRAPAVDLLAPHRFDLNGLLDVCLPSIVRAKGLVGFTLRCPCDLVLDNLIERVKDDRSTFGSAFSHKLNTAGGLRNLERTIAELRRLRRTAERQEVVSGVLLVDGRAAAELWAGAVDVLADCPNRFVLFMLIREDFAAPGGMIELPEPVFLEHHVTSWWREVLAVRGWSAAHLDVLLRAFGTAADGRLDMDGVYIGLRRAVELLRTYTDEDEFITAWDDQGGP